MAVSLLNFNPTTSLTLHYTGNPQIFTSIFNTRFQYLVTTPNTRLNCSFNSKLACSSYLSAHSRPQNGDEDEKVSEAANILKEWLRFIQSALPGGSWWNLYDYKLENTEYVAKPFTVWDSLRRMWGLVADDRWIIFIAFSSLTIAALLEISIPSLLATSIFSAESGDNSVFIRNSCLLVLICITSGIFNGLRSGCFATLNMNLLKRLRETLYSALMFQDILFFDKETVGSLTSRLGADCQRLSHIIGNDLHLILRYAIQGIGALIYLLTLSWPLALSALVICSILSTFFLVYGQYRKEAAKVTQDFTAHANEVSHETTYMMRLVRAFGTERQEFERYKLWLDRLAFISLRESAAYGFWNFSFNTLYRSTQVLAILFGGMSIMSGHATPEQLTKYVMYCEWLIYAAWRVEDNISSLLQSSGATEKVFQLIDLLPSNQFLLKGVKLKKLMGNIEFVNVSFHYPSRILIDSIPLKELDIRWLRGNIGYVGQEPPLFHMDIKANIMYGCSRCFEHEDVERAAIRASAHEFISSLPNGYNTIVDKELLSGGQKQRIAIARAMLRDPAILILDEATSALDAESEYYIRDILNGFRNDEKEKRTTIIIAHRLSTIRAANRIIVMEGGQVAEMGDHWELMRQNGLYTRLNELQRDALAI